MGYERRIGGPSQKAVSEYFEEDSLARTAETISILNKLSQRAVSVPRPVV